MIRTLLLLALTLTFLPGCFFIVDEDDDDDYYEEEPPPPVVNYRPEIDTDGAWWQCDYDESADDYFFEFETLVNDYDGDWDVDFVLVTVFEAGWDYEIDSFSLIHEDGNMWGGLVWERESELFCGEPIDVLFEAWDRDGAYDSFTLFY